LPFWGITFSVSWLFDYLSVRKSVRTAFTATGLHVLLSQAPGVKISALAVSMLFFVFVFVFAFDFTFLIFLIYASLCFSM